VSIGIEAAAHPHTSLTPQAVQDHGVAHVLDEDGGDALDAHLADQGRDVGGGSFRMLMPEGARKRMP
jgi:hypothetical protein